MVKRARRYELYLPVKDNEGRVFPGALYRALERRLLARFGGLTSHQRQFALRGLWKQASDVYVDEVIILTALDDRKRGSTRFVAKLKQDLLRDFNQLEILITESPLRVH